MEIADAVIRQKMESGDATGLYKFNGECVLVRLSHPPTHYR